MKITIINGTNRHGNQSMKISEATLQAVSDAGHEGQIVTLENFDQLFRGEKITLENANEAQKSDIQKMIDGEIHLYVVPTYHSGIPSPLKNFFDLLDINEVYEKKTMALIAGSYSNQDLGARQTKQILNGIISFNNLHSFVAPRITIINFADIDQKRIKDFVEHTTEFLKK